MIHDSIKLAIVDDHTLFRKMLKTYLSQQTTINVVVQASDAFDLLGKLKLYAVDILVTDIFMPNTTGCEALRLIRNEFPSMKVIVLSMSTNLYLINELMDFGIHAYISKADEPEHLLQAIFSAYEDKIYRNKLLTDALYFHNQSNLKKGTARNYVDFDEREKKVLQLLWQEKSNKDIANEIFLSVRSVEKIRQDMKEKLGVKSTIGLLKYALSKSIIETSNPLPVNIPSNASNDNCYG